MDAAALEGISTYASSGGPPLSALTQMPLCRRYTQPPYFPRRELASQKEGRGADLIHDAVSIRSSNLPTEGIRSSGRNKARAVVNLVSEVAHSKADVGTPVK
eukprot:SAG11_NODE_2344_length_3487_cov_28.493506_2_plen_102_part_00